MDREQAIYTKDELVVADDGKPQNLPWGKTGDREKMNIHRSG